MIKPKYLYHYTSIEGLSYILSSKQIRFSRLDLLDDLNEGKSKDPLDWGKYFFVSCWTEDSEESIPLWNMYTPEMKGVRIKLPMDMFKKHILDLNEIPSFLQFADTSIVPKDKNVIVKSYLPYEKLHGEDYIVISNCFSDNLWPLKVEYTNDLEKLNKKYIDYDEKRDITTIQYFEIAKYKKKVWAFQNEWRFRICCLNAVSSKFKDTMLEEDYFNLMMKKMSILGDGVSQKYFFMDLNDESFYNLEVLLGPKVDYSHEIIVKSLLNEYAPNAILSKSVLSGEIR